MKRNFLTTTLLAMSLLSLNLSAGSKMKCTGKYCIVDLSSITPNAKVPEPKQREVKKEVIAEVTYTTVLIDNLETIVFSSYVMTDDEVGEYELENILHEAEPVHLNNEGLRNSEYFCEKNLKLVQVVGIANTYECT